MQSAVPPTPTALAFNADTTNQVSPSARLQWITGPGRHAALEPILGSTVSFFLRNLEPGADADRPVLPPGNGPDAAAPWLARLPKDAFQVTATGQVATSFPSAATVFSLNKRRTARLVPLHRPDIPFVKLQALIREATGAQLNPGSTKFAAALLAAKSGPLPLPSVGAMNLEADLAVPSAPGRHPAVLLLVPGSIRGSNAAAVANRARFSALAAQGNVVLAVTPGPLSPGTDDMKTPLLGPYYLLGLRANLVGRTLVGLRADDVLRAVDYLATRADVDPAQISAQASGHMGLVLLHAAVLDRRIRHVTVNHVLSSYRGLIEAPLPIGAPEDVIPGVLRLYDIPDLDRALKPRLTESDPLKGSGDLSQCSTPLATLTGKTP